AIELIAATQALDLRLDSPELAGATPGAGVLEARRRIRAAVPRLERDREPGPDLAAATALVREGGLADLAGGREIVLERPVRGEREPA
ncbi:MAG TPA: hypothetical protein VFO73_11655, partial [Candidatus Limnocylindrales bacterium]|nr:hypothetical protein [Candidatus Limnocylindrales bacterium]